MKVPNCEQALIPMEKIEEYLLNPDHPDGGSKARFFLQAGFDQDTLTEALKLHVSKNEFVLTETNLYGAKFVVDGQVESPSGFSFKIRSVWIVLANSAVPILITAYPLKK